MKARERKLARYAGRFMDEDQQVWAERWYQQDRGGYRQLSRALGWPDNAYTREIADFGLRRLARSDPDRAWQAFTDLDQHIGWPEDTLSALRAELALWSAVDRSPQTADRMAAVPPAFRDDRLLEWHIRYQLTQGDWEGVLASYAGLSPNLQDDTRWRYWEARALIASGRDEEGRRRMAALSTRATFYGFLAADFLDGAPSAMVLGDNIFFGHGLPGILEAADTAGHAKGAIPDVPAGTAGDLRELAVAGVDVIKVAIAERGYDGSPLPLFSGEPL